MDRTLELWQKSTGFWSDWLTWQVNTNKFSTIITYQHTVGFASFMEIQLITNSNECKSDAISGLVLCHIKGLADICLWLFKWQLPLRQTSQHDHERRWVLICGELNLPDRKGIWRDETELCDYQDIFFAWPMVSQNYMRWLIYYFWSYI